MQKKIESNVKMKLAGDSHVIISLFIALNYFQYVYAISTVTNEYINSLKILADFRTATLIVANNGTTIRENASLCKKDIATISSSAIAGEKWALQMLDSASKIQAGILKGNVHDLGMYDQCIEVVAGRSPENIKGEHCMVSLSIPSKLFVDESIMLLMQKISTLAQIAAEDSLSFTLSLCMPSSCNEEDVFEIINGIIDQTSGLKKIGIKVAGVTCSRLQDQDFTLGETFAIIFIAAVMIFLILCTVCDFVQRTGCGESVMLKILAPFSLYTNSINLLSTKDTPGVMPAIHGLRVMSMCWVIIIHRCFISVIGPTANLADVLELQNRWYALFVFMISFTVDVSFVVSGFVTTYQFSKSINSGMKFDLRMLYLHRYTRLTPCLAVLILLIVFPLRHIGSGPIWKNSIDLLVNPCKENWWTNIFYVQNLVNTQKMCLPHTWYLAADMQLFFISRIILYAVYTWPKYAQKIFTSSFFISVIVPPILFSINGYSSTFFKLTKETSISEVSANLFNVYMSMIHRSSAYLIGVILGYVIVNRKLSFTIHQARINWAVACFLMSICVFATHYLYSETYANDRVFELVYAALARPIWAIAIAWILFACTQGYGANVTEFLSAPVFLPLSRLSYCIYLVHFVMQISIAALVRTPIVFTKFQIFHLLWGDLAIAIGLGFFFSLFFETPIMVLGKILKGTGRGHFTHPQNPPHEIPNECINNEDNGMKLD